jgi:hypothetical protein
MFFDTDCAGVVHNIVYLRSSRSRAPCSPSNSGMGLVAMAESRNFPVVVRTRLTYKRARKTWRPPGRPRLAGSVERLRFWCGFTSGDRRMGRSSRPPGRCSP